MYYINKPIIIIMKHIYILKHLLYIYNIKQVINSRTYYTLILDTEYKTDNSLNK